LHDFDAGARAPENREQAGDGGGDGHDFRAEAGADFDRGEKFFIERQTENKFITHGAPIGQRKSFRR
jgi:hypothetical protein